MSLSPLNVYVSLSPGMLSIQTIDTHANRREKVTTCLFGEYRIRIGGIAPIYFHLV